MNAFSDENTPGEFLAHINARFVPLRNLAFQYASEKMGVDVATIICIHEPEKPGDDWLFAFYDSDEEPPRCMVRISYDEARLGIEPPAEC